MSRMVTLNVKSDKIMKTFKVDGRANIKFFKTKIAPEFGNPPVPQLCLIFSGKIMKDNETLDTHAIKDNQTIHLVVKTGTPQSVDSRKPVEHKKPVDAKKAVEANKQADPKKSVDPKQSADAKSKAELVDLDEEDGSNGAGKKAVTEQKPTINTAQTLFGLDGMYALPSMVGMGMGSVNYKELQQQMKEGIKSNPELFKRHLESPFTQSLMANPEIMRTLIQSNPQTRLALESNPAVYQMLNNPDVMRLTRETGKSSEMIQNLISKIDNGKSSNGNQSEQGKENNKRGPTINATLFWDSKMQSLLQSMYESPQVVENMAKVPRLSESMFETMQENSELSSKVLLNIPIFADNPEIQQQMKAMIPPFLEQLQKPEVMQLMSGETGKNALEAIYKIQLALQRLHMVTPDLYEIMGMSKVAAGINVWGTSAGSADLTKEKNSNDPKEGVDAYKELMSKAIKRMAEKGLDAPPEERFQKELTFMEDMGFADKETNVQSLIATCGDMHGAIQNLEAKNLSKRQRS